MRISDWSSDVCSSDLRAVSHGAGRRAGRVVGRARLAARDQRARGQARLVCDDPAARRAARPERRQLDVHVPDRKSVVEGKSVSVRVDLGGVRTLKYKREQQQNKYTTAVHDKTRTKREQRTRILMTK